jgi:hypothetical protein
MINLITKEEKKKQNNTLYIKLIIAFFSMISFVAFVNLTLILPSYFFILNKKEIINSKLEVQKKEPIKEIDKEILTMNQELIDKLNLIEETKKNKYFISDEIIKKIISKKIPGIKITQISYEDNQLNENNINPINKKTNSQPNPEGYGRGLSATVSNKKINIRGNAKNREILLLFRQAFENDPSFINVDLPISNFVKGSNLEFNLNLISS